MVDTKIWMEPPFPFFLLPAVNDRNLNSNFLSFQTKPDLLWVHLHLDEYNKKPGTLSLKLTQTQCNHSISNHPTCSPFFLISYWIESKMKCRWEKTTTKDHNYLKYNLSILGFANYAWKWGTRDKERLKVPESLWETKVY